MAHARVRLSALAASALAMVAAPFAASAQTIVTHPEAHRPHPDTDIHGREVLIVYDGVGFSGDRREIRSQVEDFRSIRFNDQTSSIRVSGTWEVCLDSHFRNRCEIITSDIRDLRTWRFDNTISSARPLSDRVNVRDGIELFSGTGFSGERRHYTRDIADLSRFAFNDRARSVRVHEGTWRLCEHSDYRGHCVTLDASVRDLREYRLAGELSSIRRVSSWDRDDDDRWGGGSWRDPYAHGRVSRPDAQGPDSAFFLWPQIGGEPAPNCLGSRYGSSQCGERAAERFCEAAGYRKAAWFSTTAGRGWDSPSHAPGGYGHGSRDRHRDPYLSQVLCVR